MDVEAIETRDEIHKTIDHCLAPCTLLELSEVRDSTGLHSPQMKIKELLKLRPEDHSHLAKVAIEGSTVLLGQIAFVSIVDGQHEEHSIDIEGLGNSALQILKKELDTWSEQRAEDLGCAVCAYIEKLGCKDDLMQYAINQSFIDRFEGLL
jgi:hypothetical protein